MNLTNPSVKEVLAGGALCVAASFLLPKVLKGKTSKTVAKFLLPVGGLAVIGAVGVMAEKKLLRA